MEPADELLDLVLALSVARFLRREAFSLVVFRLYAEEQFFPTKI
jgi:hypothetical protein